MKRFFLFSFFALFIFFLMPKTNAQVTRVQLFTYMSHPNTFVQTYDTSNTCFSMDPNISATNMRITFNDDLYNSNNSTMTLSLTLTLTTRPTTSWFRWGNNAMSGILLGSGYVVDRPSSGTTLLNQQYTGVGGEMFKKQSTIVFNFHANVVPSSWSVNIPFDSLYFSAICIDSYNLSVGGTSAGGTDLQALINSNNINSQNQINSINNVNNTLNNMNGNITDSRVNDGIGGGFVNNFPTTNKPISGIITAPIHFLNTLDDTCTPVSFAIGFPGTTTKTVTLPCGDTLFWGRTDLSYVAWFRGIWCLLFGGSLLYLLGMKLFKTTEKAIDPFADTLNDLEV